MRQFLYIYSVCINNNVSPGCFLWCRRCQYNLECELTIHENCINFLYRRIKINKITHYQQKMSFFPAQLKLERKKIAFQTELEKTFRNIDINAHLLDVLVYCLHCAELHFYSNRGVKRGSVKKQAVIEFFQKNGVSDERQLSNMVESLHRTIVQDPTILSRILRFANKIFRGPDAKHIY